MNTEPSPTLLAASRIEGMAVIGADGEKLGQIDDLLVDRATGAILYAVVAAGGLLGVGERFYPLPWRSLRFDAAQDAYLSPLDRPRLEAGPAFERGEITADDSAWRDAAHAAFA